MASEHGRGPVPATHTKREADQARQPLPAQPTTATSRQVSVPVYAADPADAAVLDRFVNNHPEWDKHHQWPAEATNTLHESLTLRVELYHGHASGPRDERWTHAAYESPVGDRLWHATATETGAVWTSSDGGCRIQRDPSGWAAQGSQSWTVRFSQRTPLENIQQVVFELAE